jgi:hypothetical protein
MYEDWALLRVGQDTPLAYTPKYPIPVGSPAPPRPSAESLEQAGSLSVTGLRSGTAAFMGQSHFALGSGSRGCRQEADSRRIWLPDEGWVGFRGSEAKAGSGAKLPGG